MHAGPGHIWDAAYLPAPCDGNTSCLAPMLHAASNTKGLTGAGVTPKIAPVQG